MDNVKAGKTGRKGQNGFLMRKSHTRNFYTKNSPRMKIFRAKVFICEAASAWAACCYSCFWCRIGRADYLAG